MTRDGDGGHSEGGRSDKIRNALALISHLLPGGDRRAPQTARDAAGVAAGVAVAGSCLGGRNKN